MKRKDSIRGTLNSLNVNQVVKLPKSKYRPSSVRCIAGILTGDSGKTFTVNVTTNDEYITVTRIS